MMQLWCHRKLELKYSRHRSDGLQYISKYGPALPMRSNQIPTALIGWFTIWTFPNCKYGDPLFSLWCFLVPFNISNKCLQMSLSSLLLFLTKNLISNRHWLEHSLSDKVTGHLGWPTLLSWLKSLLGNIFYTFGSPLCFLILCRWMWLVVLLE